MVNEHYSYIATQQNTIFFFESIGIQGSIVKAVAFQLNKKGTWNLEIDKQFEVIGTINELDEPYSTSKLYDEFTLKFKNKSNEND